MEALVYQAFLTPAEEGDGGYDVSFPDLPGCLTSGDGFFDAVRMTTDAGRTWVASRLADGLGVPAATVRDVPDGCLSA